MPEIIIDKKAKKKLFDLAKTNPSAFAKIDKQIFALSEYPNISNLWIKKLKGKYEDFFCLKINDYRIKFKIIEDEILICEVDNRKDAYR